MSKIELEEKLRLILSYIEDGDSDTAASLLGSLIVQVQNEIA